MGFLTLDAVSVTDRPVGLRIDVNSPVSAEGYPTDDARFRAHQGTIETLLEEDARVVIMAHQGRPGGSSFTSLAGHADHLGALLGREVDFTDSIFSQSALDHIDELDAGEAMMLENLRFYSEEYMSFDPVAAAQTHLVSRLSDHLDLYINDAFAVSHRSQPSIVGFPQRLPSVGGHVMEREVAILGDLPSTPTPRIAILAGAKIEDSLAVVHRLLSEDLVDRVYAGGLLANVCFHVGGYEPGEATVDDLESRGIDQYFARAQDLYERYRSEIVLPEDVAVPSQGRRREYPVASFPLPDGAVPRDIGTNTIDRWEADIAEAATAICNGPVGRFEDERFAAGTASIYRAVTTVECAIAGGGDTSAAIDRFDIEGFDHISTGGGAALRMLSGVDLPGIVALEQCTIELQP